MELKTCTKCGQTFSATTEFFYRDAKTRDGLQQCCKSCDMARRRVWQKTHKEQAATTCHLYYEGHKEQVIAGIRSYQQDHREQTLTYKRTWRDAHPMLRLSGSISTRIARTLRPRKADRHWEEFVGYTLNDLVLHLESLFQPGMTWENYGGGSTVGWQIDHIRPISSFAYVSPDDPEFKQCWALSNLQPLWVEENARKGARWDGVA